LKQNHKELLLTIIETIIGEFIAGYVLAYMPFGLMRFILTILIILATFFVIDSTYKILKNILDEINQYKLFYS
jgi:ABC-type iron transport system FetAB permease component